MTTTTADPFAGYREAIRCRERLLTRDVRGETLYHVGFGEFRADRNAAIRYDQDSRALRGETSEPA